MPYERIVSEGGRGTRIGDFPSRWPSKTVKRKALSRMDGDIKELMKSLTNVNDRMSFYRLATEEISRALINICEIVLLEAVTRAPYRTGMLRSSGTVVVRSGKAQTENIAVDTRADGTGRIELRRWIESIKRPAALLSAEISFERVDRGKDIALWAHEELLDYKYRDRRPQLLGALSRIESHKPEEQRRTQVYIATKEGTGPKYLEEPYNAMIGVLSDRLQAALQVAITRYNQRTGQRVRRR